jgi:putative oxidoreductase
VDASKTLDVITLLLRVGVGFVFFVTGASKLAQGVPNVARSFAALGVPFPEILAPFVTYLELAGGAALLLGAATRLFGALFVFEMIVAIVVGRVAAPGAGVVTVLTALRLEFVLALCAVCVVIAGGGSLSIDALVARAAGRRPVRRG